MELICTFIVGLEKKTMYALLFNIISNNIFQYILFWNLFQLCASSEILTSLYRWHGPFVYTVLSEELILLSYRKHDVGEEFPQ